MTGRPASVKFLGIRGRRSSSPSVVAFADGHLVTWRPSGWLCECDTAGCDHIEQVARLLDPKVTSEDRPTPARNTHYRYTNEEKS